MLPTVSRRRIGACGVAARTVWLVGRSKYPLLQVRHQNELGSEARAGGAMAIAKMRVAELERFLHAEFPQAFTSGDITIESADGATCRLRQRYGE